MQELGCIAGGSGALPTIFLPLGDVERGWEDALADATEGLDGGDDGAVDRRSVVIHSEPPAHAGHPRFPAASTDFTTTITTLRPSSGAARRSSSN